MPFVSNPTCQLQMGSKSRINSLARIVPSQDWEKYITQINLFFSQYCVHPTIFKGSQQFYWHQFLKNNYIKDVVDWSIGKKFVCMKNVLWMIDYSLFIIKYSHLILPKPWRIMNIIQGSGVSLLPSFRPVLHTWNIVPAEYWHE